MTPTPELAELQRVAYEESSELQVVEPVPKVVPNVLTSLVQNDIRGCHSVSGSRMSQCFQILLRLSSRNWLPQTGAYAEIF